VDAIPDEADTDDSPLTVETAVGPRPHTPIPDEIEQFITPVTRPIGTGHVLGSDPSAIPEWRRGIPIRR
jgi:hypothetical protein